jgi:hypothetical protein
MIAYLFMDCEMGGRDLKYSLLTAYFLATDAKFQKVGDLYLEVKPDDGTYIVSGQGMSVNQIDLQEHDKRAITYKDSKPIFFNFLQKCYQKLGRLTPVGHGVKGDIEHCIGRLTSQGSWEQFCTYHYVDTSVWLQILRIYGKMPHDCDGSIKALHDDYFGLKVNGEDHDCRVDTLKTLGVVKEFVRLGFVADDDGPASHEVRG